MTKEGYKRGIGKWGEGQAALFLIRQGYTIVWKNFRWSRYEIDIIAQDTKSDTLCFVEVKTRVSGQGSAERSVERRKQKRIQRVALHYCLLHEIDIDRTAIRFEVVSVYLDKEKRSINFVKHILLM